MNASALIVTTGAAVVILAVVFMVLWFGRKNHRQ
jgi:hypothetical protein